jgi:hypothetical protein
MGWARDIRNSERTERVTVAYCTWPKAALGRGSTEVIGQRIQVGLRHARRIVGIEIHETVVVM